MGLARAPVPWLLPEGRLWITQRLDQTHVMETCLQLRTFLAPVTKKSRFFFGFRHGWTQG